MKEASSKKGLNAEDVSTIESRPAAHESSCCTRRENWFLTFAQLIMFIVPVLSATTLILQGFKYDGMAYIAHIGLIVSYVIGLSGILYIIMKSHNLQELVSGNTENHHHAEHSNDAASIGHLIINTFISLLGIGDSLFNLSDFVDDLLNIINKNYDNLIDLSYLTIALVDESYKCFYHLCLLLFVIYRQYYVNTFKCRAVKAFIFSLSVSCLFQWIIIIVQELNHKKKSLLMDHAAIIDMNMKDKDDTYNDTYYETLTSSFENVQRFLFPFGSEYRIMLFIEFLCIYLINNENNCSNATYFIKFIFKVKTLLNFIIHKCYAVFEWFCETIYGIGKRLNRKMPEIIFRYGKQTITEQVIVLIFMIIGIELVSLAIIIVFVQDYNHLLNASLVGVIKEISAYVLNMIALVFTFFVCIILYKRRFLKQLYYVENTVEPNVEKESDFLFLICSNLMLIAYNILIIIAYYDGKTKVQDFPNTIRKLELLFMTCPMVQSILQVGLLWVIEHKLVLDKGYIKILKLLNFAMWVFETFSVVNKGAYEILESFYTKIGWEILIVIFLPVAIFYRFHSFVMLIKIRSNHYKNEYTRL